MLARCCSWRYSLSTLIALCLLICGTSAWVGLEVRHVIARTEAVRLIERTGGYVEFAEPGSVTGRRALLRPYLSHMGEVADVYLVAWDGVRDEQLQYLRHFENINHLYLGNSHVTDAGATELSRLARLEGLDLHGSQISNAGMAQLCQLTQLEWLDVSETSISDSGLVFLSGMQHLEYLDISGTQVTDDGLMHLCRMSRLKHLFVEGTRVSHAGVASLEKSLPEVEVVR